MTAVVRVPVSEDVINWAIEHGEKSEDELLKKYDLQAWKNPKADHDNPTFKQIQSFSRETRIPFNYFFNQEIPQETNNFVKFRTINNTNVQPSRRLIDTIHEMESRQEWMKAYLLKQEDIQQSKLLNSLNVKMDSQDAAKRVISLLKLTDILEKSMTDDDYFTTLRIRLGSLGIMVMQNGIVGTNTHRPLDVAEFRAFVLIDETVPLIFINSADSKKAKIFSLVHEFIHVMLGQNEVLNVSPDVDVADERWINAVTINALLPEQNICATMSKKSSHKKNLMLLSRKFHTSLVATAIRLETLGIYGRAEVKWAQENQKQNLQLKTKSSGGDFYNTAISRVDRRFANAVINNESAGSISISSAADMLGVTLKTYNTTVDKILGMA